MSNQPVKMWSGRFRKPLDRTFARWMVPSAFFALPFFFLVRGVATTEPSWACVLVGIAALIIILLSRVNIISQTPLIRGCLRLYLSIFALTTIWFALNIIRVLTYDDAVEGRTNNSARIHWLVVEVLQPIDVWIVALTAVAFVIVVVITLFKIFFRKRTLQTGNV